MKKKKIFLLLTSITFGFALFNFTFLKNNQDNLKQVVAEDTVQISSFDNDPINNNDKVKAYYQNYNLDLTGNALGRELSTLINKNRVTSGYSKIWNFLPYTDADPKNPSSDAIVAFYRGTTGNRNQMNKEHVWPDSRGGNLVEGDPHMVRPTFTSDNSSRGNKFYGNPSSDSGTYDPGEFGAYQYRGIAARIIFYSAVSELGTLKLVDKTTDSTSNKSMGKLSTLLKWNLEYGIDETEMLRNDVLSGFRSVKGSNFKYNRNPFIDDRTLPCKIWGDTNATTKAICKNAIEVVAPTSIEIDQSEIGMAVGSSYRVIPSVTPSDASKNFTWFSSNPDVATVSSDGTITAKSEGTTEITVSSDLNMNIFDSIIVNVSGLISIRKEGAPIKTIYYAGQSFDPTGLRIYGTFADGERDVTNLVQWSPSKLLVGMTSVTGMIYGKTIYIDGLTVNQPEDIAVYTLINSNADIIEGSNVVIAANSKDATAGNITSTYMEKETTSFSLDKKTITNLGQNTVEMVVNKINDKYTLTNSDGNTLKINGSKNVSWTDGSDQLTFDINNGNAKIFGNESYGNLQYNSSSPRFTTYTSGQTNIQLYQKTSTSPIITFDSIELEDKEIQVSVGSAKNIRYTATGDVTFSSTNSDIAIVTSNGSVIGVNPGDCVIVCTCGTETAFCSVHVSIPSIEGRVNFLEKNITLCVGESKQLQFDANSDVKFSTLDGSIVLVNQNGIVTGLNIGQATITVKCGDASDTCIINVIEEKKSNKGCAGDINTNGYLIAVLSFLAISYIFIKKKIGIKND